MGERAGRRNTGAQNTVYGVGNNAAKRRNEKEWVAEAPTGRSGVGTSQLQCLISQLISPRITGNSGTDREERRNKKAKAKRSRKTRDVGHTTDVWRVERSATPASVSE